MLSASYKTKHFLFQTIKLLLVFGAVLFLYQKLSEDHFFSQFHIKTITRSEIFAMDTLVIILFFSFANWALEILKWKVLLQPISPVSYRKAAMQSLIAFSVSIVTPNKLGEYGIRPLFFEKSLRNKIALLTAIHHFLQLMATLFFGFIGFLFLLTLFPEMHEYLFSVSLITIVVIITLIVISALNRKPWLKVTFLNKGLQFIGELKKKVYLKGLAFSMARYLIFSHQFIFLLSVYKVSLPYPYALAAVTTVYLLSTLLPAISFFDVLIKGSVAIFVFGMFNVEELSIMKITGVMWFFNFILPLFPGGYYTLKIRYPDNEKEWKLL